MTFETKTGQGTEMVTGAIGSGVPFAFTWDIPGGAEWRFTLHAYPLLLLSAATALTAALRALDPAQMTGKRQVMGQSASAVDAAFAIGGDLHEHLGQMIAYARMNKIVPPWSK